MQAAKMQEVKMLDQIARHVNIGHEKARCEIARPENAIRENERHHHHSVYMDTHLFSLRRVIVDQEMYYYYKCKKILKFKTWC